MIDFYTWNTPNGRKVAIMLEECGLDYQVHPVDIDKGEQFDPAFLKISPNNRIPAIVDRDAKGGPLSIFESGAILLYLGEKTGQFLPATYPERARVLQWTMWQMGGVGPMVGQYGHFLAGAPEKIPYAIKRYREETLRLLLVLDGALASSDYVAGAYSIADMLLYPWIVRAFQRFEQDSEASAPDHPNIAAWRERLAARPAVQRGMKTPERF